VRFVGVRETRTGLRAVLDEVARPGGEPVVVGSWRKPEAVVMSVEQYEDLSARAALSDAVRQVIASSRLEGLEPTAAEIATLVAVDAGRVDVDDAIAAAVARATAAAAEKAAGARRR